MDTDKVGKSALDSPVIDNEEAREALAAGERAEGLPPDQIDIDSMKVTQNYDAYTDENHEVWGTLFRMRMEQLHDAGSRVFLDGARAITLRPDRVPQLTDVNARLKQLTGWSSHGVPGYLPAKAFVAFLAKRQFPTTITVRPKTSMDYLPEPDIIHDVFGHVPLHADPVFADFLQTYGKAALHTDDPHHIERLRRRKTALNDQLAAQRAAVRFEPAPDAAEGAELPRQEKPAAGPKPEPARPAVTPEQPAADSYTERLLKAKRKVWEGRDRR